MMPCLKITRSKGRFFQYSSSPLGHLARVEGSEWNGCHRVVALMLTCPNPGAPWFMAFPRARVYINELVRLAVKTQTDAGCLPPFCEALNEML